MTTCRSSPTTYEMGETRRAAHVEADDVLALRVRQENGLGTRRNPELLPRARRAESLSARVPLGRQLSLYSRGR
jgi:hypothetical protein